MRGLFNMNPWRNKPPAPAPAPEPAPAPSSSSVIATPHGGEGPPNEGQKPEWWKRGEVIDITDVQDWNEKCKFIKGLNSTLVVVEFAASWCGPSRFIAPFIKKQAEANRDVLFVRLNYDQFEDVAAEEEVEVVPTFLLFKGGRKVIEPIVGAKRMKLSTEITKFKN